MSPLVADFAALLSELPGPVAACIARCRVASLGHQRARMRRLPAERLAIIAAESREAIAVARLYRSGPVSTEGVEYDGGPTGLAYVPFHWSRSGRNPHWDKVVIESTDVRAYDFGGSVFATMSISVANPSRILIKRRLHATDLGHAERTARRWAACARAVLAVRPYLPESVETGPR